MLDDRDLYDESYFMQHYLYDPKRDKMQQQEIARIASRMPHGGLMLDIGCGVGNFMRAFGAEWTCIGMDVSAFAREQARRKGFHAEEDLEHFFPALFDLVVFRGTWQHIATPMADLVQATHILRPGGMLVFLATPDTDSLVYKIWGNLPMLDPDRNWILPGARWMSNVLRRLGYQDIEVVHPYWDTPYAGPLRDMGKFVFSLFFGYRKFAFPGNVMEIYAIKEL